MKQIYIKKADRDKLVDLYKVSRPSITNALHFKTNSLKSIRMRVQAMNFMSGLMFEF